VVDIVAVTATATRSGRAVVFVEAGRDRVLHRSHIIDYVPVRIEPAHLRTSAAIPVLFPPVRVDAAGWGAGLVRRGRHPAQTPIKPALDLGAHRLVVFGTDAIVATSDRPARHEGKAPGLIDGRCTCSRGALVDPLAEDIVSLGNVNLFVTGAESAAATRSLPRMGWIPDDLAGCPDLALDRLAGALGVAAGGSVELLSSCGGWQDRTRREHPPRAGQVRATSRPVPPPRRRRSDRPGDLRLRHRAGAPGAGRSFQSSARCGVG